LATTKRGGGDGSSERGSDQRPGKGRPRIHSSHEGHLAPKRGGAGAPKGPQGPDRARPRVEAGPRTRKVRSSGVAASAPSVASDESRALAIAIAVAGIEKKAVGLEILDVAGKVDYADFLVVMTGRSDRHTQALAQGIEEALRKKGVRPVALEGLHHGAWVLMDFGDVVVHVFQDEARQLYDIEGLWLDARRLPVPAENAPNAPAVE
jgi:ribosome-associated protein